MGGGGIITVTNGGGIMRLTSVSVAGFDSAPRKLVAVTLMVYTVSTSGRASACRCVFVSDHAYVNVL
jgi:hypothetical protein